MTYAERLYGYATGWLGWSDEQAMATSIYRIEVAMDALNDKHRMTVPGLAEAQDKARKERERRRPKVKTDDEKAALAKRLRSQFLAAGQLAKGRGKR